MKLSLDDSGRYHRQELITWWDQSKLKASKVLVVGAGAIGNEVVKNLALVGVGTIKVCDMDTIENSNLARCAFFREADQGFYKAEVLARRAQELNACGQKDLAEKLNHWRFCPSCGGSCSCHIHLWPEAT